MSLSFNSLHFLVIWNRRLLIVEELLLLMPPPADTQTYNIIITIVIIIIIIVHYLNGHFEDCCMVWTSMLNVRWCVGSADTCRHIFIIACCSESLLLHNSNLDIGNRLPVICPFTTWIECSACNHVNILTSLHTIQVITNELKIFEIHTKKRSPKRSNLCIHKMFI